MVVHLDQVHRPVFEFANRRGCLDAVSERPVSGGVIQDRAPCKYARTEDTMPAVSARGKRRPAETSARRRRIKSRSDPISRIPVTPFASAT
jgi:hypothetical protein